MKLTELTGELDKKQHWQPVRLLQHEQGQGENPLLRVATEFGKNRTLRNIISQNIYMLDLAQANGCRLSEATV